MPNILSGKCEISLDGKEVGLIFSNYSIALFCEIMDCALSEVNELLTGKSQFRSLCNFIWCGIETHCVHFDKKNDYSKVEVAELFKTISDEDVDKIVLTINTSLNGTDEVGDESSKKK